MQSVNVNEFYNANISFNIGDEDLALINAMTPHNLEIDPDDEDAEWLASPNNPNNWTVDDIANSSGELEGYSEVGEGHFGDDRIEVEHEAMCDTLELSDDYVTTVGTEAVAVAVWRNEDWKDICDYNVDHGYTLGDLWNAHYQHAKTILSKTGRWNLIPVDVRNYKWERVEDKTGGRWAHMKDAYCEERDAIHTLWKKLGGKERAFGEMATLAKWRKMRFIKMVVAIDKCNNIKKLQQARWDIKGRYINSVKSCAVSKEWYSIYLTSRDMKDIEYFIDTKVDLLRHNGQPECCVEGCTKRIPKTANYKMCGSCAGAQAEMNDHLEVDQPYLDDPGSPYNVNGLFPTYEDLMIDD